MMREFCKYLLGYLVRKLSFYLVLCCFYFFVISNKLVAQKTYKLLKKIPLKSVTAAAIDQKEQLYIADNDGNIMQYDSTGKKLLNYSPEKIGNVTSLTTSQTMRLFAFYRDFQEYIILNRFLDQTSRQKFNQENIGFVKLATLASDNSIWVFDESDISIKKFNPQLNKIITKFSLDLMFKNQHHEVVYLQEYQNRLYLVDNNSGIWIFDNLGNFKKKLLYKKVQGFHIKDEYLYLIQNGKIKQIQLYNTNKVEQEIVLENESLKFDLFQSYLFVTNSFFYIITPTQILVLGTDKK